MSDNVVSLYHTGDVVALNSGGPAMTVEAVEHCTSTKGWFYNVVWFCARGLIHRSRFKQALLMEFPDPEEDVDEDDDPSEDWKSGVEHN